MLDYVALRISIDIIEALWYNFRFSRGLVDGLTEVFCDNKSVINNLIIPTSVLNKIHNAICYHRFRFRESQAAGVLCVGLIVGKFNLDDLFTKTKIPGNTRHNLVEYIFSNRASPIGGIDKA